MEIKKPAVAGTLESSDCQIIIRPNPGQGRLIDLESNVKAMFGDSILETVGKVLDEFDIPDVCVEIRDKGALDCVIRSRMQCVICRGAEIHYDWPAGHSERREMPEKTIRLKRSSLYASGSSPVNMIQAVFYNEDVLVYDLEDSVPPEEKDAARFLVYSMVKNHRPRDKYVAIRVNGIYSEYLEEDLRAAVRANPNCIRIPKVEYAEEVRQISARIAEIEEEAGLEVGKIDLICNIESYMGVINAMEIAHSDPRVVAMAVSAEDLTASLKAQRTKQGLEVFYARNAVLLACRSAGIDALDVVFGDINDKEGLMEDTALAKNLGFDGKTVIHPRQIDVVNSYFTPSAKEIRYALRVLKALEEGKNQKKGAVTLDGGMIDRPMKLRALTTLAQAEAAGVKIKEGMS